MEIAQSAGRLGVALAAGLLIGLERERRKGDGPGRAPAGIRTFTLVAAAGGLSGALGSEVIAGVALAAVAATALVGYWRTHNEDPGLTTEVALVVTFLVGALAYREPALGAGAGVVTAALLASRTALHRLVRSAMSEEEVHDLLLFAAAAVVVLPFLPNRTLGPYDVFNPFKIWRLVVLVMGIGGLGHVATRLLGARFGLAVSGLAGGFISSVVTIGSMGAIARRSPGLNRAAVSGAVLSTVATVTQLAVVVAAGHPGTLRPLALPLLAGGLTATIAGTMAALRVPRHGERPAPSRSFTLTGSITFAAVVTGVLFVSAALNNAMGNSGVVLSATLAGFADTHAAAASVASLAAAGRVDTGTATVAILLSVTTNAMTKLVAARAAGPRAFALPVSLSLLLVVLMLWLGELISTSFG